MENKFILSRWLNNKIKVFKIKQVEKPCHCCGFCPYGQLVEEFPLGIEEEKYAIKHNKYVKWSNPKGFPEDGTWVSCPKTDKGASPDINWASNKVKNPYSCEVFGHECPVYYHAEGCAEETEKSKSKKDGK